MATHHLRIEQGSTFEWLILVTTRDNVPLDMSGYVGGTAGARGMIRSTYEAPSELVSFDISILNKSGILGMINTGKCHLPTTVIDSLKDDLDGSCYLLVRLEASDTSSLPKGNAVYDLEIEDTFGYVIKPYKGTVVIAPESTK